MNNKGVSQERGTGDKGSFAEMQGQMIRNVQEKTNIDLFTSTLPGVFMSTALLEAYKYWVANGKNQ